MLNEATCLKCEENYELINNDNKQLCILNNKTDIINIVSTDIIIPSKSSNKDKNEVINIKNNNKKISKGSIIGIILGCVGILIIVAIIIIWLIIKRKKENKNDLTDIKIEENKNIVENKETDKISNDNILKIVDKKSQRNIHNSNDLIS